MNLVIKPSFSAIVLTVTLGAASIQGCSYNKASSDPVTDTSTAPYTQEESATTTPNTSITESENNKPEPKAIPFEDVLKQDQALARKKSAKPAPKPAPKATKPIEKEKIALNPSTPLRPPRMAPTSEQQSTGAAETDKKVQSTAESISATLPPIEFSLDQLPITIHKTWLLSSNQNLCSLKTVPVEMDDGAGKTPIFLQLTNDSWIIDTKSDIDLSYQNTGLYLDNGVHIELESLVKDTKIVITKQKEKLTEALKTAGNVKVSLGFWPTWPVSETQTHTLSVAHFSQAYVALETCNQLISAR